MVYKEKKEGKREEKADLVVRLNLEDYEGNIYHVDLV